MSKPALVRSPSKPKSEMGSAGQYEFPALFTIEGGNRHELILVNPGHELSELKSAIEALASSSPNCAEFMHKYRSKDLPPEKVGQIKVRWGGRDKQLFPKETILTEDNSEAVLRMMAIGQGNDVLDVHLEKPKEKPKEGAKK